MSQRAVLEMTSPRPWRFAPGQLLVALATMRRNLGRAFTVGTNAPGGHGMRVSSLKGTVQPDVTTPPVSPLPDDDGIMSFYLLRHGQTNFNAVGRIQVKILDPIQDNSIEVSVLCIILSWYGVHVTDFASVAAVSRRASLQGRNHSCPVPV